MTKHILNTDDLKLQMHWYHIHRLRRKASLLLNEGAPCTDPRLIDLSNQILCHGMAISRLWARWKALQTEDVSA